MAPSAKLGFDRFHNTGVLELTSYRDDTVIWRVLIVDLSLD